LTLNSNFNHTDKFWNLTLMTRRTRSEMGGGGVAETLYFQVNTTY